MSYLGGALKGFQSIAYSGSTPVPWGNIFVNPASLSNTFGVIGPCGAFDEVLNQVLGPDPTSCNDQTGPLPGEGSNTGFGVRILVIGQPRRRGGSVVDAHHVGLSGTSQSGGSDLTGPNSGLGGLSQLISPLLQGVG